jgi:hypothetical protein
MQERLPKNAPHSCKCAIQEERRRSRRSTSRANQPSLAAAAPVVGNTRLKHLHATPKAAVCPVTP